MSWEVRCEEREESGDGELYHCFHPYDKELEICCWCGDLFKAEHSIEDRHGLYNPGIPCGL
jgi:hypothetical protein